MNEIKAAANTDKEIEMKRQRWRFGLINSLVALILIVPMSKAAPQTYIEDFTTTEYKDALHTTALWDTVSGELKLFSFELTRVGGHDTPGYAWNVVLSGNYVYVADGQAGLQVFDITSPTSPTLVGSHDTPGTAFSLAIAGTYAYVADSYGGFHIFDISDPTNPTLLGSYDTPGFAYACAIAGDYAYVADGASSFLVIDITDSTNPTLAGSAAISSHNVTIAGDYAYVTGQEAGLQVVDISDPTNPTLVGGYDTPGFAYDVAIAGNYAYVADDTGGLQVIDITNPEFPVFVAHGNISGFVDRISLSGDFAYLANQAVGFQVVDISDPTNPTLINSYEELDRCTGLAIAGDNAFVTDRDTGLHVIDIADPYLPPTYDGGYSKPGLANEVVVDGNYAYVASDTSGLQVVDISDPSNPFLAGVYNSPGKALGVTIAGDYAYVADHIAGLQVVDINDPTNPTLVSNAATYQAWRVAISGDYAYVADFTAGLQVIDISDPSSPVPAGNFDMPGLQAMGVAVAGDYAYVVDGLAYGLKVVDISDPTNPALLGSFSTPGIAQDVEVSGFYAYVVDYIFGLHVIDISDPTNPTFAGGYETPGSARGVVIAGDYAFVADYAAGLHVIDISDPTVPTLLDSYVDPSANGIAVSGDHAFVANSHLKVIRVFNRSLNLAANRGQSLPINELAGEIHSVMLTTAQTDSIRWELSADGGLHWEEVIPGAGWFELTDKGSELIWRSTHIPIQVGANPTCSFVQIDWLYGDGDGDGVPDGIDQCPTENASYFDRDGDGCIDETIGCRHIEYWGYEDTLTYFINEDGAPNINNGSDFTALHNAMNAWPSLAGTDMVAEYGGTTTQDNANILDQVNLITFTDNEYNFPSAVLAVGIATSFTEPTYFNGRFYRPGQIVNADMIFNPAKKFKTPSIGGTGTDLFSTALHEAGHLYGLSHTAIKSSTMFFVLPPGQEAGTLEADDELAYLKAYPNDATLGSANRIGGTVVSGLTGEPVPGAIIFAIDVASGDTASCEFTLPDGSYLLLGLPDGDYYLSIYPLDGSSRIGYLQAPYVNWFVDSIVNKNFVTEYWDQNESAHDNPLDKDHVTVSAGSHVTGIDIITNIDDTPPTVLATNPADSETDVPIDAAVLISFSEAIDVSTLKDNFSLVDALSEPVYGNAVILKDDSLVVFVAYESFDYTTSYTLTLDTGLKDKAGNSLAAPYAVTYTTTLEPPLNITSLVPNKGVVGSIVVINGAGFDPDPLLNTVRFQGGTGTVVADVNDVSLSQLIVTVPEGAITGDVTVEVGGGPPSNSLTFTVFPMVEVARGYDAGGVGLGALPRALTVLPDGSYAYVATRMGAMAVDLNVANFLDTTSTYISEGLDDVDVTPDGKRVYGVSRMNETIHVIDSDAGSGTQHQELDELSVGTQPLGIAIGPSGRRAYVPTADGDIQVWDIHIGSGTYNSQIGTIVSPDPNLRRKVAVDPTGDRLLALTGTGNLLVFDLGPDTLLSQIGVGPNPKDVVVDLAGQRAYVSDATGLVTVVSLDLMMNITDIATGGSLRGIAITPAGLYLCVVNRELNILDIIDLNEDNPTYRSVVATVPLGTNPVDVELSPDGNFAYSLIEGDESFVVTNIGFGPVLRSLSRYGGPIGTKLVFAGTGFEEPMGSDYATFTGPGGTTITVTPAERATGVSRAFTVPPDAVSGPVSVTLSMAGGWETSNQLYFEWLNSTSSLGTLRMAEKKQPTPAFDLAHALALSPIGDQVLIGSETGHLLFMDTDPLSASFNQLINDIAVGTAPVSDIAITPDGRRAYVVVPGDASVYVVNSNRNSGEYGQLIGTVGELPHLSPLTSPREMAMSPDGAMCLIYDESSDLIYIVDILLGSDNENMATDSVTVIDATEIAFHPVGGYAYVTSGGLNAVLVIDMEPLSGTFGDVIRTVDLGDHHPVSLSFLPNGDRCLVFTKDIVLHSPYIYTLDASDPSNPITTSFVIIDNAPSAPAGGERIDVSPRGDRAIMHANDGGLYDIDLNVDPYQAVDVFTSDTELGTMDHDFTPDGSRVYAVGASTDSLVILEFSAADNFILVSGDGQTGIVDEMLPAPLRVGVLTSESTPAPGVTVTFQVTSGGGIFPANSSTQQIVVTDQDGLADLYWTLGPTVGSQTVEASGAGLAGSPIQFTAIALEDPATLPLTLVEVYPADVSTDVSITTSILAIFSRGIRQDTSLVNSAFYVHRDGETAPVPAILGFADSNRRLSLTPIAPLDYDTTYRIQIKGELEDENGGTLQNPDSSSFHTEVSVPELTLASVNPPSATVAVTLVLSGTGFDPNPSNNTVLFNDLGAAPFDAGVDFLKVEVPLSAVTGTVRVQVGATISNALPFTVLTPTTSPEDSVVATVTTGYATKSAAITPNGLYVYAVSPESDKVVPIEVESFLSLPGISVGDHPISIDIHPAGTYAYIANFNSGSISIIDVDSESGYFNTLVETAIVGGNPIDVAVSPDGNRIYVANAGSGNLDVIDGEDQSSTHHQVVASVKTGSALKSVVMTPDGSRIYIGTNTGYIVMDGTDYSVVADVSTGAAAKTVIMSPDGALLILLTTEGEVLIIDVVPGSSSENQVVASAGKGSSTQSITMSPDGALLYLIQEESDLIIVVSLDVIGSVSAVDPENPLPPGSVVVTVVDSVYAGEDPASITFDPSGSGFAVVTNAGPQTVTFLNIAGPPLITLHCPSDSTIGWVPQDLLFTLDGFEITNTSTTDLSFYYYLTAEGPVTLIDNSEDSTAISGTSSLLPPGGSFSPPDAAFEIPCLEEWSEEVVTYHAYAVEEPNVRDSCTTVITIPPQWVDVLISNFEAMAIDYGVKLTWEITPSEDIEGFKIYRTNGSEERATIVNTDGLIPPHVREYVDKSVQSGVTYLYTLGIVRKGKSEIISGIQEVKTRVFPLALYQNYPNPFNPTTTITFSLPEKAAVNLSIYNIEGKLVATLVNETLSAGFKEVAWNGTNVGGRPVSSGVYFYRLRMGKKVLTRKLLLLR